MMNYFLLHKDVDSICIFGNEAKDDVQVTIVIPTYKRIDLLKKTLDSIINQKAPQKMKYQVIVVSNDPDFDWRCLNMTLPDDIFSIYRNKSNLGMVGNMNRCAFLAKGEYIAYVQDDDVLLDDYLVTIEQLVENHLLDQIDCLIPNRYYFYDCNNNKSNFGRQAYKSERKKLILEKILTIGVKKSLIQKVTPKDCAETWYNCYSGGPTCGVIFKRSSLMETTGFPEKYPYVFDYVFFIDFSERYNVCLYDQYLSIYRMVDSASNRPDVQVDFYKGDMYLLEKTKEYSSYVKLFEKEIIKFSIENKSKEAQKLIETKENKSSKVKYMLFRVTRFIKLMRKNTYRRNLVPAELQSLL